MHRCLEPRRAGSFEGRVFRAQRQGVPSLVRLSGSAKTRRPIAVHRYSSDARASPGRHRVVSARAIFAPAPEKRAPTGQLSMRRFRQGLGRYSWISPTQRDVVKRALKRRFARAVRQRQGDEGCDAGIRSPPARRRAGTAASRSASVPSAFHRIGRCFQVRRSSVGQAIGWAGSVAPRSQTV